VPGVPGRLVYARTNRELSAEVEEEIGQNNQRCDTYEHSSQGHILRPSYFTAISPERVYATYSHTNTCTNYSYTNIYANYSHTNTCATTPRRVAKHHFGPRDRDPLG
jgi:hypothetical protein